LIRNPKQFWLDSREIHPRRFRRIGDKTLPSRAAVAAIPSMREARTDVLLSKYEMLDGNAVTCSKQLGKWLEEVIRAASNSIAVLVLPSFSPNAVHVAVRKSDISTFYSIMVSAKANRLKWYLDGKTAFVGQSFADMKRLTTAKFIILRIPISRGLGITIRISLYTRIANVYLSNDEENATLRRIPAGVGDAVLGTPGIHYASDALGANPVHAVRFPIDIVYTWVNDQDPHWRNAYSLHAIPVHKLNEAGSDATMLSRFKNRDELKYSLRSVFQYMPWVNKIFVVSNCKPPSWFDVQNERVKWVDHSEIFEAEFLPVFSSHAIETCLHKIPQLSEHFLYFNDDFFINKNLPSTHFFEANGLSKSNLEKFGMIAGPVTEGDPDYLNAARNGAQLIWEKFGHVPTQLHRHSPYALRKSVMERIDREFEVAVKRTRSNRFRQCTDISVPSFLYHHYAFLTGNGLYAGFRSKLIKSSAHRLDEDLESLIEQSSIKTFCLNDGLNSHLNEVWNKKITRFLQIRLPYPADCECLPPRMPD
jgi:hypothetical protein